MTTLLHCVNGHQWRASAGAVCPFCGSADRPLITPPTLPDSRPPLALGDDSPQQPPTLPGYEVLEELGKGGMGIVYKARQRSTGELVALKVIRKERLGHTDHMSRFRREALATARMQHPNIVGVIEADLEGPVPYLAMEYVPGVTLQALVDASGPLPIAQACEFIRQTAVALQHAHEQGLVHRDIKPSNLMALAPAGLPLPPRPVIKVLDMGVARLFQSPEQEAPLTTLTRDGSVIGTPDYIAPEQLENPRGVDIRADLYSLGCTFYFLLTGQVPFPGGSLVQKLDRQRWHAAPSPNQLRKDVSSSLAAVVRKLMHKAPDDRFQTPGELGSALESLLRTGELPGGHQLAPLVPSRVLTGHTAGVVALAFVETGRWLVSAGNDRTVRVWDVLSGAEVRRLGDGKTEAGCLAVVPGTGLVLAGAGVSVRAFDVATGKESSKLSGHSDAVRCVAVSADGKRAVTGGDHSVRVWDLERGLMTFRFNRHSGMITGLALSPDGKLVLSSSRDQSLRLWEAATGREVRTFAVPKGPVLCVAWSPDGKGVYSGHFDRTIRLWDETSGRELRRFNGHKQMVSGLAFTPKGTLLSASHDQTVRLWDAASGGELGSCQGRTGPVLAVACGPLIASAGLDLAIRLWPVPATA